MNWLTAWAHKHGHWGNTYKPAAVRSWWLTSRGDLVLRRQYYCKVCKEADAPEVLLIATAEQIAEAQARDRVELS